jgi:predicted enzyme related to lactoylglutathione lyase
MFPDDSNYFDPSDQKVMINYVVENVEELAIVLREEGVEVIGEVKQEFQGKFIWLMDPEGRKVELWEPNPEM